jgi:hypothetical protein
MVAESAGALCHYRSCLFAQVTLKLGITPNEVARISLYGVSANIVSQPAAEQTADGTLHPLI